MTITALPTPPSRQDPANFAVRADAFLGALPTFATETNAVALEVNTLKNAATTSANNASISAINAATYAQNAQNSANSANTSAINASNSAAESNNSAQYANTSAVNAAASFTQFNARYLGAKASAPSVDNSGGALVPGALYWNSTESQLYIRSATAWNQAATTITGAVLSINNRQGNVVITESDITNALPFSSTSLANNAVIRDSSGNFSANIISAVDFNSTSDFRLKENIVKLNTTDSFYKLNPVEFTWKSSGKKSYGLVAQEVEQVFPELVVERSDGTKGVNYIPIIAMLLDKVQELSYKVEQLSAK